MKSILRGFAEAELKSKEFSRKFGERSDLDEIYKNLDKISEDLSKKLFDKIEESGTVLSEKEFEKLVKDIVRDFFNEHDNKVESR